MPKRRPAALTFALAAALLAWGCRRPAPPAASRPGAAPPPAPLDYGSRIAPLLAAHCTGCHRPGGIAPMALTTYEQVREHGAAIARATQSRSMPPWLPDEGACADLKGTRALPDDDVRAIAAWVERGMPRGPAPGGAGGGAAPPAGGAAAAGGRGLRAGEAQIVVAPKEPYVPRPGRADDYHCFVLEPPLAASADVIGVHVAPGAPSLVHHVLLFEVSAAAARKLDALDRAEPGPGYTCFGGPGINPAFRFAASASAPLAYDLQLVAAWAPGGGAAGPVALPPGTALRLRRGSRLVMQVHYSLHNAAPGASDRTRVELFTGDAAGLRQGLWVPLADRSFRVPPGAGPDDPRAVAGARLGVGLPLKAYGVAPHMHLRGKSIRVEASAPAPSCLVDVPRWDFHLQEAFWLERPVLASEFALRCTYDNRPEAQPEARGGGRAKARELRWGEGTDDEMCLAFLYVTLP
ncbi:MAG TPA: hypothetical protein VFS43_31325 [Polyangiaceae bacterium]|nr:hypothetical protein [Polyangiaceae bacterium]